MNITFNLINCYSAIDYLVFLLLIVVDYDCDYYLVVY